MSMMTKRPVNNPVRNLHMGCGEQLSVSKILLQHAKSQETRNVVATGDSQSEVKR